MGEFAERNGRKGVLLVAKAALVGLGRSALQGGASDGAIWSVMGIHSRPQLRLWPPIAGSWEFIVDLSGREIARGREAVRRRRWRCSLWAGGGRVLREFRWFRFCPIVRLRVVVAGAKVRS